MNPTEEKFERDIVAAGADVAARVRPADVDEAIAASHYWRVPDGVTTVCALTLKNGFTVVGSSACASPANYSQSIGEAVAFNAAREKIWPLLGYALKQKLAATPTDYRDRVRAEREELDARIVKLDAFIESESFASVPATARALLKQQLGDMRRYCGTLDARIAAFDGEQS